MSKQKCNYFDHSSPGSRRPEPILCEDLQTVWLKVLVEYAADWVGLRGVNKPKTSPNNPPRTPNTVQTASKGDPTKEDEEEGDDKKSRKEKEDPMLLLIWEVIGGLLGDVFGLFTPLRPTQSTA